MVGRYKKRVFLEDILTGEIAIEVTGVVGVSPALWYFRYIASIFLTLHKRLCPNHKLNEMTKTRLLPFLTFIQETDNT